MPAFSCRSRSGPLRLLYSRLCPDGVPLISFALFMGLALAITAFPVLARILIDRGLSQSDLGVMALTCAAIGDVTAWCLLAVVVGVAQAQVQGALVVVLLALAYVAAMVLIVRPILRRLAVRYTGDELPRNVIVLMLVALLLSALATELIGIHALFGTSCSAPSSRTTAPSLASSRTSCRSW